MRHLFFLWAGWAKSPKMDPPELFIHPWWGYWYTGGCTACTGHYNVILLVEPWTGHLRPTRPKARPKPSPRPARLSLRPRASKNMGGIFLKKKKSACGNVVSRSGLPEIPGAISGSHFLGLGSHLGPGVSCGGGGGLWVNH